MKLENDFVVRRGQADVAALLASDAMISSLLPDTEIVSSRNGERETRTRVSAMGAEWIVRFIFKNVADGGLRFEKIADGRIWKSLVGNIRLSRVNDATTRIQITMEGATKGFIPEFTIKGPIQSQLDQMSRALRAKLEQT
jgi:hypothetical protein